MKSGIFTTNNSNTIKGGGVERIKFRKLHEEAQLPRAQTLGSIGLDIHAFLLTNEGRPNNLLLPPRFTRNVSTGLEIEAPPGKFLMVCSRSGLASKSIFVTNAPGIIDPDYRGELRVLLYNGGHESQYIRHGDRIAQLLVLQALHIDGEEVEALSETERGKMGFGSTGL